MPTIRGVEANRFVETVNASQTRLNPGRRSTPTTAILSSLHKSSKVARFYRRTANVATRDHVNSATFLMAELLERMALI
jgi:hypothetical protein